MKGPEPDWSHLRPNTGDFGEDEMVAAVARPIRLTKGQLSRYDRVDSWIYVSLDFDGTERWVSC
jgi:hypothetical protein